MELDWKKQVNFLDDKASKKAEKYSSPLLMEFFEGITSLGSPILVVLIIAVLQNTGETGAAIKLFAGLLITGVTVRGLKKLNNRKRPENHLDNVYSEKSFPSGHSTTAFMTATVLNSFYSKPLIFLSLSATVASSRVYLEDHYLSDVLAGGLIGTFIGAIVASL
mgnify:CR=1 FL=1